MLVTMNSAWFYLTLKMYEIIFLKVILIKLQLDQKMILYISKVI